MGHRPELAVDTETTGLDGPAFVVSVCDAFGEGKVWRWEVDPRTREVCAPGAEVDQLQELADTHLWVLHNSPFDMHRFLWLGLDLDWQLRHHHDTLLMAHCFHSLEPHGLKRLACKYCNYPNDDEEELEQAVKRCRRLVSAARRWLGGKRERVTPTLQSWLDVAPVAQGLEPEQAVEWLGQVAINEVGGSDRWKADYWLPQVVLGTGECEQYALGDVERTMVLYGFYQAQLQSLGLWGHYLRRREAREVLVGMERRGVMLHLDNVVREQEHHRGIVEGARWELTELAGGPINLESTAEVARLVYPYHTCESCEGAPSVAAVCPDCDGGKVWEQGAPHKVTPKGQPSVDREVLTMIQDTKVGRCLGRYRRSTKTLDYLRQYQEAADAQGVLRPSYNQTGTATCRWSSQRPNAQNIKQARVGDEGHGLRSCFRPREGHLLISADWSSIEMRIMSYMSREPALVGAYERGEDPYALVGRRILGEPRDQEEAAVFRQVGKHLALSKIYGSGAATVAATATRLSGRVVTEEEGRELSEAFDREYPAVFSLREETLLRAEREGCVSTAQGYRLRVESRRAHTTAMDYVVQGTASYLAERSLVRWWQLLEEWQVQGGIWVVVHDEINTELRCDEPRLLELVEAKRAIMEDSGLGYPTPVDISICEQHWGSKVPWEEWISGR